MSLTTTKTNNKKMVVPFGNINNEPYYCDFSEISNLIISGTTGSGKTSFVRSVLARLIEMNSSADLKLIINSSKVIDYSDFNGIENLLIPVNVNPDKSIGVIYWAKSEAERRMILLNEQHSLEEYPNIIIVIDDYQEISNKKIAEELVSLLKISRNVKMHCVILTSLPTTKVISTDMKANIPFRIAFRTASKLDSRIIIDENGAEKLCMPGEMIYKGHNGMVQCQSLFIPDVEITTILNSKKAKYDILSDVEFNNSKGLFSKDDPNERDVLCEEAKNVFIENGFVSTSLLQRRFRIGYARAVRIMEQLERDGVVESNNGSKPNDIIK